MAEAAINSSPLIVLARAGQFDLLRMAGDRVVVPRAVVGEIMRRGPGDVTVVAIAAASWIRVVDVPHVDAEVASRDLGVGESAVLSWVRTHPGSCAVIDDRAARRCATVLGIPLRGTLSLVADAKRAGILSAAAPVVQSLRACGIYVSDRLVTQLLRSVGE